VSNWNPHEEKFLEKDLGSVSESYMLHPEAGTMSSGYLGTGTMFKSYRPAPEGYMLYPEVVIPTDKIEEKSEKNPS
jgi:hypothetical protein